MIKQYQDDIDCIILSLVLPSLDGVGILKYLKKENINKRVILYTYNTNLDLLKLLGEYNILFVLLNYYCEEISLSYLIIHMI